MLIFDLKVYFTDNFNTEEDLRLCSDPTELWVSSSFDAECYSQFHVYHFLQSA